MDATGKNYGKLYGFFLDVCKRYVENYHKESPMGETGEDIYMHFHDKMFDLYRYDYRTLLNNYDFSYLSDRQLTSLNPVNGRIKEKDLDLSLYFKIINLLQDRGIIMLTKFVVETQNELCHLSMKSLCSGFTQEKFEGEFDIMFGFFEYYGVDKNILETCKTNMEM